MITITVKPYLRTGAEKQDGTCPVQLMMRMPSAGKQLSEQITLKNISIPARCWDQKLAICTRNFDDKTKAQINDEIQQEKIALIDFMKSIKQGEKNFTPSQVKDFYINQTAAAKDNGLDKYIEDIINGYSSSKISSRTRYDFLKRLIKSYDPRIQSVKDININFVQGFDKWLKTEHINREKKIGMKINSVATYHKIIKAIVNKWNQEAQLNGLFTEMIVNPYGPGLFKIMESKTPEIHLTTQELKAIKNAVVEKPCEQLAKDRFLFAFYCGGVSFRDIFLMTRKNFPNGNYFEFIRHKTQDKHPVLIKNLLCPEALEILARYEHRPNLLGWAGVSYDFHKIEDVETEKRKAIHYDKRLEEQNRKLKKIALSAGVNRNVTSKVVRDSWANIAMNLGEPSNLISTILGHAIHGSRITRSYMGSFPQPIINDCILRVAASIA